eukprot:SM000034S12705  [mRNA]  locus=s34:324385:326676:+ [translate_table: standard]
MAAPPGGPLDAARAAWDDLRRRAAAASAGARSQLARLFVQALPGQARGDDGRAVMAAGPHYDDRMASQRPRSRRRSVLPASEAVVEVAVPASGGKPGAPWLEASRASAGQDRYGGISPAATDQGWDTDAGYLDRLPPPPRAHDELEYDFSAGLAHSQARSSLSTHSHERSGGAVTREELGVATWTLLHTLAAQFPDRPTKQQQRDVKDLPRQASVSMPPSRCSMGCTGLRRGGGLQPGGALTLDFSTAAKTVQTRDDDAFLHSVRIDVEKTLKKL